MQRWVRAHKRQLAHLQARLRHPGQTVQEVRKRAHELSRRLEDAWKFRVTATRRARLQQLEMRLDALSPQQVLGRGYAIVRTGPSIVSSTSDVCDGDTVAIQVSDGLFGATVRSD